MLTVYVLITTLIVKLMVFFLLLFFYFLEKRAFIFKWASCIGLFAANYILELMIINEKHVLFCRMLQQMGLIGTAFLAVSGSYSFVGKRNRPFFHVAMYIIAVYTFIGWFFRIPFFPYQLPIYLFIGIAAGTSGLLFMKYSNIHPLGRYWVGWVFILWGIHMIDYPFLRPLEWFAPYGYLLSAFFAITIPSSVVLLFLQQIKRDLVSQNEFRNQLIDFLPDAVFIHHKGKIVFANPTAVKMLGAASTEELRNKPSLDRVHPDYIPTVEYMRNAVINSVNGDYINEIKLLRMDGTPVDVESRGLLYTYNGEKMLLSIHRDLSELKQSESLRKNLEDNTNMLKEIMELDKLKTEFFANISHELRTPLNVLLSSIQLMDSYISDASVSNMDKFKTHLPIMKQNCFRLLKLINNLIDTTKADAGFLEFHPQNCNIVSIVEETTHSVYEYVKFRGVDIQFDTQEEEIITACDIEKMERIMLNLLSNAVKFTPKGGNIYVNITCDEDNYVYISVRDTGIGIQENKLDIIFERFRQADQTLAKKHEGSGIGLSLVKSLVEMHGGSVSVRSTFGSGTEFILMLPIRILHTESVIYRDVTHNGYTESINLEFADIYTTQE